MNSFFRTLSLVSFSLSLILLTGCGMSPGSRSGGVTMTTQAYTSVTTTTFAFVSPLTCSLKIKGITATATTPVAAAAGEVVSIEVTASGGIALGGISSYNFKKVRFNEVDYTALTGSSTNQSKASVSITMPTGTSATLPVLAEVARIESNREVETVQCYAAIALGTSGLTLNVDNLVALPNQSINITAALNTTSSGQVYFVPETNYSGINIQVSGNTITVNQNSANRARSVFDGAEIRVKALNSSSTVIARSAITVFFAPGLKCDIPQPAVQKNGVPFNLQAVAYDSVYLSPTGEALVHVEASTQAGFAYGNTVINSGKGSTSGFNLTMTWNASTLALPNVNQIYFPIKLKARRILGGGAVVEDCTTPEWTWVPVDR